MRCSSIVALALVLATTTPSLAAADGTPPVEECVSKPWLPQCQPQATGDGGPGFTVSGSNPTNGAPGAGSPGRTQPVAQSPTYVRYDYAPTCTGNTRLNPDVLCGAAVTTCQPPNTGLIAYWRWEVTVQRTTGKELTVTQSPGTYCLGPGNAGLPLIPALTSQLTRDLQRLIILRPATHVRPNGTTLVNYPTQLYTDATTYTLDPVTLLGHTVVVTAHPKTYDWYFGDGTSTLDAGPGQATDSDVRHTYTTPGTVSPYVVITWTGTFTVDGGAPHEVYGTAQTTGPGTPLQVKQARAELVTE